MSINIKKLSLLQKVIILTTVVAGVYFTFGFERIETISPAQIQSDNSISRSRTSVDAPVTGLPLGWKNSGIVRCLCSSYGEKYTNISYSGLFIDFAFWLGLLFVVSSYLGVKVKKK